MIPKIKAGDIVLTHHVSFIGNSIVKAEKLIDPKDKDINYSHGLVVTNYTGQIFESTKRIGFNQIEKYEGCKALIARHNGMNDDSFIKGLTFIKKWDGLHYPWWRLGLFFVGMARYLHNIPVPVCTELVGAFLKAGGLRTGLIYEDKQLGGYWGASPAMFENAVKDSGFYKIIYEGIL